MAAAESPNHHAPNFEFTQIEGSQLDEPQESSENDSEVEEFEVSSAAAIGVSNKNVDDFAKATVIQHDIARVEEAEALEERDAAHSTVTFSPVTVQVKERYHKRDASSDADQQYTRRESHTTSDVSTLLDTAAGDECKSEEGGDDDYGGEWINASLVSYSSVRKRKDLEKKANQIQKFGKLELVGAKENDANNSDTVEMEVQAKGVRKELTTSKIDESDQQTQLTMRINELLMEKRNLEERLGAVVSPANREQVQRLVAQTEHELRRAIKTLTELKGVDHAGEMNLRESLPENDYNRYEEDEEDEKDEKDEEEELEEPVTETSSERLIQNVYEQSHKEPSASQRMASDLLMCLNTSKSSHVQREHKLSQSPSTLSEEGEEEAELEFERSQDQSPSRLNRLRKVGSSSKRQNKAHNLNEVLVDQVEEEGRGNLPTLNVHQIPLSLLREINEVGADSQTLQSGEWKSRIGKELIACGWEWRASAGLETDGALFDPGSESGMLRT